MVPSSLHSVAIGHDGATGVRWWRCVLWMPSKPTELVRLTTYIEEAHYVWLASKQRNAGDKLAAVLRRTLDEAMAADARRKARKSSQPGG